MRVRGLPISFILILNLKGFMIPSVTYHIITLPCLTVSGFFNATTVCACSHQSFYFNFGVTKSKYCVLDMNPVLVFIQSHPDSWRCWARDCRPLQNANRRLFQSFMIHEHWALHWAMGRRRDQRPMLTIVAEFFCSLNVWPFIELSHFSPYPIIPYWLKNSDWYQGIYNIYLWFIYFNLFEIQYALQGSITMQCLLFRLSEDR